MRKDTNVYEFCKMFQSLYNHQWDYNKITQNVTLFHLSLFVLRHTLKDTHNEQSYINTRILSVNELYYITKSITDSYIIYFITIHLSKQINK